MQIHMQTEASILTRAKPDIIIFLVSKQKYYFPLECYGNCGLDAGLE